MRIFLLVLIAAMVLSGLTAQSTLANAQEYSLVGIWGTHVVNPSNPGGPPLAVFYVQFKADGTFYRKTFVSRSNSSSAVIVYIWGSYRVSRVSPQQWVIQSYAQRWEAEPPRCALGVCAPDPPDMGRWITLNFNFQGPNAVAVQDQGTSGNPQVAAVPGPAVYLRVPSIP